jgi:SAM-dependent methyltransferase
MNLRGNIVMRRDWEIIGAEDPYYGVLTEERFLQRNWNENARIEFFASGEHHVHNVVKILQHHFDCPGRFERALDFGCGVGRLLIPLAKVSNSVVGVDIAESMLREARQNCHAAGATNITLLQADNVLGSLHGAFDLVHSSLVFQHIPRRRGEQLFRELLQSLRDGGYGVIQLPYNCGRTVPARLLYWGVANILPLRYLRNVLRGKRFDAPYVQMNAYDLSRIFYLLQEHGCHSVLVRHCYSAAWGLLLFFQKKDIGNTTPY